MRAMTLDLDTKDIQINVDHDLGGVTFRNEDRELTINTKGELIINGQKVWDMSPELKEEFIATLSDISYRPSSRLPDQD